MIDKRLVLDATIDEFNEKGIKFTMDDLAKRLSISKKTIYKLVPDKQTLFMEMADYVFDEIKESEQAVYDDPDLSTLEKLQAILIAMPNRYVDIDFRKIHDLQEEYPDIYAKVAGRLDSGWEQTIALYEQAKEEGLVRSVQIPVLKAMLEGAISQFLTTDMIAKSDMNYQEALDEMLSILMDGITQK